RSSCWWRSIARSRAKPPQSENKPVPPSPRPPRVDSGPLGYDPSSMSVRRVAMFSIHTSPLAQPGSGDGGGMNVYVRALASSLARAGVDTDVFTRAEHPSQPHVVEVERGFRVVHVDAGPRAPVAKHELSDLLDVFVDRIGACVADEPRYDVLHANYWLSGEVAHRLKHRLDVPLVSTFHTLARVKAEAGVDDDPHERAAIEQRIISCSDLVLASTPDERAQLASLYDVVDERLEIVAPGVDHTL